MFCALARDRVQVCDIAFLCPDRVEPDRHRRREQGVGKESVRAFLAELTGDLPDQFCGRGKFRLFPEPFVLRVVYFLAVAQKAAEHGIDKAGSAFLPEYARERHGLTDRGAVGDLFAVQELIQPQIQDKAHLAVELADWTAGIAAGDVLQCEQTLRYAVVQHGAEAFVRGVQVRRIQCLIEQQVGIAARRERPQQQPDCK